MEVFIIPPYLKTYTNSYDGVNHKFWNQECSEILELKRFIRSHFLNQTNNTCFYCKHQIPSQHGRYWDIDHILPKSLYSNFLFESENLIVSCVDCNSAKGNKNPHKSKNTKVKKLPKGSDKYTFIHPFYDNYDDHIQIKKTAHSNHHFLLKKTEKGSQTIDFCNLNRFIHSYCDWDNVSFKTIVVTDKLLDSHQKLSKQDVQALITSHLNQVQELSALLAET
ncbi:HNH endonuclease [Acinetobacter higginsii]|uniref:HNH endonuclease n=1 Tax=Acinetobacter higginsii TaxID=70347 RepID=UPI001F4B528C|nr:HNH endonuclease [Acinetobacter higginsii]MCH7295825.1 HNH endonuclease [Acinetobacter higginsii]MDO3664708.1 HNH endonuclease domain-containing protein [Acinetobacter higginsii]